MGKRKYTFNEKYFDIIDNEHKAYWLGFIYADGCVGKRTNGLNIGLQYGDIEHLEKFKKDIEYSGDIQIKYTRVKGKVYKTCSINLNSVYLAKALRNKGVEYNKTLLCNFPSNDIIPEFLMQHFIRGFMDGDGSIKRIKNNSEYSPYDYSLCFIGTYNMMKGIANWIGEKTNIVTVDKCNTPIYEIGYHGNNLSFEVLNKLYSGSTIYLKRKYERYLDFINMKEYNYYEKLSKDYAEYSLVLSLWEEGLKTPEISKTIGFCQSKTHNILKPMNDVKNKKIDSFLIENKNKKTISELSRITGRSRDYIRSLYKKI